MGGLRKEHSSPNAIETFEERLVKIDSSSRIGFVCAISPKEAWTFGYI